MTCIVGGRLWPFLTPLMVVAVPICGKTLRRACYESELLSMGTGWLFLMMIPLTLGALLSIRLKRRSAHKQRSQPAVAVALIFTTVLYFLLNTVMFDFAWPWSEWTGRTPNQTIFLVCAVVLTAVAAGVVGRNLRDPVR